MLGTCPRIAFLKLSERRGRWIPQQLVEMMEALEDSRYLQVIHHWIGSLKPGSLVATLVAHALVANQSCSCFPGCFP